MPFFIPVAAEALIPRWRPSVVTTCFFPPLSLPSRFFLLFSCGRPNVESTVWSTQKTRVEVLGRKWWSRSILTWNTGDRDPKSLTCIVCLTVYIGSRVYFRTTKFFSSPSQIAYSVRNAKILSYLEGETAIGGHDRKNVQTHFVYMFHVFLFFF